jgi:hypothetical protein
VTAPALIAAGFYGAAVGLRDKEHCFGLTTHYLFDAIPVGRNG